MTEGRTSEVPGYGYGAPDTARSPLGIEGLDLLEQTAREVGGTVEEGDTNYPRPPSRRVRSRVTGTANTTSGRS